MLWSLLKGAGKAFGTVVDIGDIGTDLALLRKKAGEEATAAIKKSFEECRGELMADIITMKNEAAKQNLLNRIARRARGENDPNGRPYLPGSEMQLVNCLTRLKKAHQQDGERTTYLATLEFLGEATDSDFDDLVEMLDHDVIRQIVGRTIHEVRAALPVLLRAFRQGDAAAMNWLGANAPGLVNYANNSRPAGLRRGLWG